MMADGMFVGKIIGSKALAAINLVFPIIMIVFAVGDMIAVGASVKMGIKLGEKEEKEALLEQKMERWEYLTELAERIEQERGK